MIATSLNLSIGLLLVGLLLCLYRLLMGPRIPDRILALAMLDILALSLLVLFGMRQGSLLYFEIALIIGAVGFVGALALSKYLVRRNILE
ncbi:MAG: K+/H+ antiporter subunit F [Thermomonas sp.]|uniref:K+/H+ antiporter subunit F n=1 Tax=Thermomonas sp. TaxID=1971895 RepID=UPI002625F173|nr:K+/H+ antiporter subunit F [Thermomonas sp.]MCC7097472.1 K+/H+ antiporter subunit F [Thermomonas sp.]